MKFILNKLNFCKRIASCYPLNLLPKLRDESLNPNLKCSSKLGHFKLGLRLICDREGIRTPNPQSRNLIFYPVELRSHFVFSDCESTLFFYYAKSFFTIVEMVFPSALPANCFEAKPIN